MIKKKYIKIAEYCTIVVDSNNNDKILYVIQKKYELIKPNYNFDTEPKEWAYTDK